MNLCPVTYSYNGTLFKTKMQLYLINKDEVLKMLSLLKILEVTGFSSIS